jgi:hypothetical protein
VAVHRARRTYIVGSRCAGLGGIAQNGMKAASEDSLTRLGNVDKELNLTKSQREKRAIEHINGDADLKAVHRRADAQAGRSRQGRGGQDQVRPCAPVVNADARFCMHDMP